MEAIKHPEPSTQDQPFKWDFPFQPYEIQQDFMTTLYRTLDSGRCGIFESPTGTGKSLSIICSALHWYETRGRFLPVAADVRTGDTDEASAPAWMRESAVEVQRQDEQYLSGWRRRVRQRVKLRDQRQGALRQRRSMRKEPQRQSIVPKQNAGADVFALEDYHSDEEERDSAEGRAKTIMAARRRRSARSDSSSEDEDDEDELMSSEMESLPRSRKIFFCSRTHSQLSQFLGEMQRTPFKSLSVVALGSRKQLCVNDAVRRAGSDSRLNDRCTDLHGGAKSTSSTDRDASSATVAQAGMPIRARTPRSSQCPYLNRGRVQHVSEYALSSIHDIEQLERLGRSHDACPYYASRAAVAGAELVLLPYSMLLHRRTRESLGIDLLGNVVLFDEAHNIIDAVNDAHSAVLTLAQLAAAHAELAAYAVKYRNRLKAKNRIYVQQLLAVLRSLTAFMRQRQRRDQSPTRLSGESPTSNSQPRQPRMRTTPASNGRATSTASSSLSSSSRAGMLKLDELALAAGIDHFNLFKLERYIERSGLVKKLNGFVKLTLPAVDAVESPLVSDGAKRRSSLQSVHSFLSALCNDEADGRVLVDFGERRGDGETSVAEPTLRFVMLNPAVHFREVVDQARSVVLAGGTMQPIDDVVNQLFGHLPRRSVEVFSCGHVIPPENLLSLCVPSGPSGKSLDLTFEARATDAVMDEVGGALVNLCSVVPAGIVVFLPSYDYERKLHARWQHTGLLARLAAKKRVFRDGGATGGAEVTKMDELLEAYARACGAGNSSDGEPPFKRSVSGCGGGILFSVVGGKLSEGINFTDDLARCIVMVGLPFANPYDVVLRERMKYLDGKQRERWIDECASTARKPDAGKEFYENLCMKAVNQCVGRAIRHRGDYSTIVFLDRRYARPNVARKLPAWMTERYVRAKNFGDAFRRVSAFFRARRSASESAVG